MTSCVKENLEFVDLVREGRKGSFSLHVNALSFDDIQEVMKRCVVVEAYHNEINGVVRYTAFSPVFAPVGDKGVAPDYVWVFQNDYGKRIVTVRRIDG